MAVVFIDTSVLCCLLNVPGKNQKREDVFAEYSRRRSAGDVFVLPISAVIETGNHIEQLGPGLNDARHHCADALCQMLRNVVDGAEQFVMHPLSWDEDLLREFCDGGASTPGFRRWPRPASSAAAISASCSSAAGIGSGSPLGLSRSGPSTSSCPATRRRTREPRAVPANSTSRAGCSCDARRSRAR